jgi:hypothetical protein
MSVSTAEPNPWPRRQWMVLIVAVFVFQTAIIFVASDRKVVQPRPVEPAPSLSLAGTDSSIMISLMDPTLFARPHPRGFTGPAWLTPPKLEERLADPPDPPESAGKTQFLAPGVGEIGASLGAFVQTNNFARPSASEGPGLNVMPPPVIVSGPLREKSIVKIEGALAERKLKTPMIVSSRASLNLLTNTVVQLCVDGRGRPLLPVALVSSSGNREADQEAMEQASRAMFEEKVRSGPRGSPDPATVLDWGWLVFEWNTLPLPATNGVAAPSK